MRCSAPRCAAASRSPRRHRVRSALTGWAPRRRVRPPSVRSPPGPYSSTTTPTATAWARTSDLARQLGRLRCGGRRQVQATVRLGSDDGATCSCRSWPAVRVLRADLVEAQAAKDEMRHIASELRAGLVVDARVLARKDAAQARLFRGIR